MFRGTTPAWLLPDQWPIVGGLTVAIWPLGAGMFALLFGGICLEGPPRTPEGLEFSSLAFSWLCSKIDIAPLLTSGEVKPPLGDASAKV